MVLVKRIGERKLAPLIRRTSALSVSGYLRGRTILSDDPQEFLGLTDVREELFFFKKFARVYAPPASAQVHRMLQMQHLVINDVLDDVTRHTPVVEDAADDDRIVSGIVVPKPVAGVLTAPGELRPPHQSVEESPVEVVEDLFEMVMMPARRVDLLPPAHLPHEPRFRGEFLPADIAPVTRTLSAVDRPAVKLGQQNMSDRVQHCFGRAFEQIRESNVKFGVAQANGVVDRDKRIKADVHRRSGRARPQFGIRLKKYFGNTWGHGEGRLAR